MDISARQAMTTMTTTTTMTMTMTVPVTVPVTVTMTRKHGGAESQQPDRDEPQITGRSSRACLPACLQFVLGEPPRSVALQKPQLIARTQIIVRSAIWWITRTPERAGRRTRTQRGDLC
jgi:hypothetical protein